MQDKLLDFVYVRSDMVNMSSTYGTR